MVLVIDTSSARSALAVLTPELASVREAVRESGRGFDLQREVAALVDVRELTGLAVATGPGSFTGLRVGAAYAVGLALGLGLRIRPLPALDLQAARAQEPATAVIEAGRGRVYYQPPGGRPGLGEPAELPSEWPVVGWLRPETAAALESAGGSMLPEERLATFASAAARVARGSTEIACDSLTLDYMQPLFRTLRGPGSLR